ncbi:hypothetical protein ACJX0J_022709, partial [Zea mays]
LVTLNTKHTAIINYFIIHNTNLISTGSGYISSYLLIYLFVFPPHKKVSNFYLKITVAAHIYSLGIVEILFKILLLVTVAGVFSRSLVPFSRSPLSERSTTTALTDSSSCRWKIMSLEHVRNLKKLAAQSQTDDEDINDEGGGIREILCLHFKPRRKSV